MLSLRFRLPWRFACTVRERCHVLSWPNKHAWVAPRSSWRASVPVHSLISKFLWRHLPANCVIKYDPKESKEQRSSICQNIAKAFRTVTLRVLLLLHRKTHFFVLKIREYCFFSHVVCSEQTKKKTLMLKAVPLKGCSSGLFGPVSPHEFSTTSNTYVARRSIFWWKQLFKLCLKIYWCKFTAQVVWLAYQWWSRDRNLRGRDGSHFDSEICHRNRERNLKVRYRDSRPEHSSGDWRLTSCILKADLMLQRHIWA